MTPWNRIFAASVSLVFCACQSGSYTEVDATGNPVTGPNDPIAQEALALRLPCSVGDLQSRTGGDGWRWLGHGNIDDIPKEVTFQSALRKTTVDESGRRTISTAAIGGGRVVAVAVREEDWRGMHPRTVGSWVHLP